MSNTVKSLLKLQTVIRDVFIQDGEADVFAEERARKVVIGLANKFGGQQIYFPKLHRESKAALHHQIITEFNGSNHDYLANKHGLSVTQIYNITRKKKLKTNKPQ